VGKRVVVGISGGIGKLNDTDALWAITTGLGLASKTYDDLHSASHLGTFLPSLHFRLSLMFILRKPVGLNRHDQPMKNYLSMQTHHMQTHHMHSYVSHARE
jgi:hypothetical protein